LTSPSHDLKPVIAKRHNGPCALQHGLRERLRAITEGIQQSLDFLESAPLFVGKIHALILDFGQRVRFCNEPLALRLFLL
jgi:hypothetical protein